MVDVDHASRRLDIEFHQVQERGAAGDEPNATTTGRLFERCGSIGHTRVSELFHDPLRSEFGSRGRRSRTAGWGARLASRLHVFDRADDVRVGAAPTDVAAHQLANLVL